MVWTFSTLPTLPWSLTWSPSLISWERSNTSMQGTWLSCTITFFTTENSSRTNLTLSRTSTSMFQPRAWREFWCYLRSHPPHSSDTQRSSTTLKSPTFRWQWRDSKSAPEPGSAHLPSVGWSPEILCHQVELISRGCCSCEGSHAGWCIPGTVPDLEALPLVGPPHRRWPAPWKWMPGRKCLGGCHDTDHKKAETAGQLNAYLFVLMNVQLNIEDGRFVSALY